MRRPEVWLSLLFLTMGCIDEPFDNPVLSGTSYFPLNEITRTYQVESIRYTPQNDPDTTRYWIREQIKDSVDSADGVSYLLLRERADSLPRVWRSDSVWTVRQTDRGTLITRGTIPEQVLAFPLTETTEWNGNAFSNKDTVVYRYRDLFEPFELVGVSYDSTVTVEQSDVRDPLEITANYVSLEVYAPGVGLIYKEVENVTFCGEFECAGEVIFGAKYRMELTEYEVE